MNSRSILSVAGVLVFLPSLALAQQSQHRQTEERPPDGGTREVVISILIPSLPNAAFTATLHTTSVKRLGEGTEIKVWNQRKISRDKLGRIFQERRGLVPDDGKHEPPLTQIEISDPVKNELILGLETVGTRQVRVIQAGEIGNDGPLVTKREFWYSPKLGMNLLSTREDPTSGMQKFEVSELVLEATDEKLFEPPEGSTILDLRKTVEVPPPSSSPN